VSGVARRPLTRAGLLLGVAACVVGLSATGADLVTGPGRGVAGAEVAVALPGAAPVLFAVLAAVMAVAVLRDARWAALTGTAAVAVAVFAFALTVARARISDDLAPDAALTLGRAGITLAAAAGVAALALALCLAGMREWVRPPARGAAPEGIPNHAVAALVLGLGGIAGPPAAMAVAFAVLGLGEIRLSGGTRGGRGQAVAGLVLGLLGLAFWAFVLVGGMFAVTPAGDG
jgi:hypothetical protein